ncbi:MAG: M20/M25/M40 family metallo-hydrolase [Acidobacteriota bacterium]
MRHVPDPETFARRVRMLAALGHRGSATAHEDRAADLLIVELEALGIAAAKVPFPGYTSLGARILLHVLLGALAAGLVLLSPLLGAGLVVLAPVLGAVLGALVLTSYFLESLTLGLVLSRLLPMAPSRNVCARIAAGAGETRRRLIVIGHLDTQRTGFMWRPGIGERFAKIAAFLPGALKSPLLLPTAALATVPVLGLLAALQLAPALVSWGAAATLIVAAVASVILGDWARGPFVPGACDNATGAAAVLALAEAWQAAPVPDVELVLLLTGCEESGLLGATVAARALRRQPDGVDTLFLNLDTLGYGAPRYLGKEYSCAATPVRTPPALLELCAEAAAELGLEDAGPHTLPVCGDGLPFLVRGIHGVTILTFEPGPHLPNYHQLTDTADRMDFAIGWRAVELGEAVLRRLAGAARVDLLTGSVPDHRATAGRPAPP